VGYTMTWMILIFGAVYAVVVIRTF
jgi:hypothetical protein